MDFTERSTMETALGERVAELEAAVTHIKTLQGVLPICMHCHKIRNDKESWERMENYIQQNSSVQFSHSLCPECLDQLYPKPQDMHSADEPQEVDTGT